MSIGVGEERERELVCIGHVEWGRGVRRVGLGQGLHAIYTCTRVDAAE